MEVACRRSCTRDDVKLRFTNFSDKHTGKLRMKRSFNPANHYGTRVYQIRGITNDLHRFPQ